MSPVTGTQNTFFIGAITRTHLEIQCLPNAWFFGKCLHVTHDLNFAPVLTVFNCLDRIKLPLHSMQLSRQFATVWTVGDCLYSMQLSWQSIIFWIDCGFAAWAFVLSEFVLFCQVGPLRQANKELYIFTLKVTLLWLVQTGNAKCIQTKIGYIKYQELVNIFIRSLK